MPRLMSVAFTADAVRARTKRVTRRKGWLMLREGHVLTLCEKVMGRRAGEPLVRIVNVEVIDVRRERLYLVSRPDELLLEGFPDLNELGHAGALAFIDRYFTPQGIGALDEVTRIEWRYLDDPV